ncbi:hypothetical protein AXF22_01845 [Prevotella scopos JCM 17725]|nr:hypothetical protein AXF22_01845 [Prevotella scopos JCM 17725]
MRRHSAHNRHLSLEMNLMQIMYMKWIPINQKQHVSISLSATMTKCQVSINGNEIVFAGQCRENQ